MFTRMLALFSISLIFTKITESKPTIVQTSKQLILENPGRIPVYIRPGDTPLDEISHDLAEAFNFYAQKNNKITFGRSLDEKPNGASVSIKDKLPENIKFSEIDKFSLESDFDSIADDQDADNQINILQKELNKNDKLQSNIQRIHRL
ncbi:uncharacterized protein LOC130451216 [Diorhabda sublineata]|uniref:uncharacterized protein LOC130451216 n=1 Tax=Diorhabda sublineata TaxID=1163346 RepID=UPI0024E18302|nr:uncharacterized protein LOC130451216 [Diorhabda sublineata]